MFHLNSTSNPLENANLLHFQVEFSSGNLWKFPLEKFHLMKNLSIKVPLQKHLNFILTLQFHLRSQMVFSKNLWKSTWKVFLSKNRDSIKFHLKTIQIPHRKSNIFKWNVMEFHIKFFLSIRSRFYHNFWSGEN